MLLALLLCHNNNLHLRWIQLDCCHSGLCHGFWVEAFTNILCLFLLWSQFTQESQPFGFVWLQPFRAYPWQVYVLVPDLYRRSWSSCSPTTMSWGCHMLLKQQSPSHSINVVRYAAFGSQQSNPIPLTSVHSREMFFFVARLGSSKWHGQLYIRGGHYTWWFWYGDCILGWWIYMHLLSRIFCCLITNLP